MQRIVPTSDSAKGESSFPMTSVLPLGVPGLKTDEPLYVVTWTSFPATMAAPTSSPLSAGCPIKTSLPDLGMKRTRPGEASQSVKSWPTVGECFLTRK